jgi:hypothetical protein
MSNKYWFRNKSDWFFKLIQILCLSNTKTCSVVFQQLSLNSENMLNERLPLNVNCKNRQVCNQSKLIRLFGFLLLGKKSFGLNLILKTRPCMETNLSLAVSRQRNLSLSVFLKSMNSLENIFISITNLIGRQSLTCHLQWQNNKQYQKAGCAWLSRPVNHFDILTS